MWRDSKEYLTLRYSVDPAVYSFILVVGLLGNVMLLFLFTRHRKLRTLANVMIINLAICDVINLGINGPLHLLFHYEKGSEYGVTICRVVLALREFLLYKSALAVIAVITQRSMFVVSSIHKNNSIKFTVICLVTVWILPLITAIPPAFLPRFYEPICLMIKRHSAVSSVIVLNTLLFCVLLPTVVITLSFLTARRLLRDMPGESRNCAQQRLRDRSARVTMALAGVFVCTYCPFWVWVFLVRCIGVYENKPVMVFSLYITKYLLFANGCFNPIALFAVSSNFRRLFVLHLCPSPRPKVYDTKC